MRRTESVSVVLPFLGDADEAREVVARLHSLELGPDDELVVADNTPEGVVDPDPAAGIRVVRAPERRSGSHARNAGAAVAGGDWLLFLDADCIPPAGLIDAYFDPPPDARSGVVAGEIAGDPHQEGAVPRWTRSRRGRWVEGVLAQGLRPAAITANMLVRRAAFEGAGGLRLGGGADFDLSWRLQDSGWGLERRPAALVLHRDRETLRELGEQARAYGSHTRNLRRLHGPAAPRLPGPATALRSLGAAAVWGARREGERAGFALLDAFYFANAWIGSLGAASRRRSGD